MQWSRPFKADWCRAHLIRPRHFKDAWVKRPKFVSRNCNEKRTTFLDTIETFDGHHQLRFSEIPNNVQYTISNESSKLLFGYWNARIQLIWFKICQNLIDKNQTMVRPPDVLSLQNFQTWRFSYYFTRVDIHPVMRHAPSIASGLYFFGQLVIPQHQVPPLWKTSVRQRSHQRRHATSNTTFFAVKRKLYQVSNLPDSYIGIICYLFYYSECSRTA